MLSAIWKLSLFKFLSLLDFVFLFRCVVIDAALRAAGFCNDPVSTAGEDRENLAFRHIPPPPLL